MFYEVRRHCPRPDGDPLGDKASERGMPPADCAAPIADAIERDRAKVCIGGFEVLTVYVTRFVPAFFRQIVLLYYDA